LQQFVIAGADSTHVWADAVIEGDSVIVSASSIAKPVSVRYAWADNPADANLYSSDGPPAAPFRTNP
jgi:sialate O-acetylesterase